MILQRAPRAEEGNWAQRDALARFRDNGLTAEHLRGADWLNDSEQIRALGTLIQGRNMSPPDAINTIRGLSIDQVRGIADGDEPLRRGGFTQ